METLSQVKLQAKRLQLYADRIAGSLESARGPAFDSLLADIAEAQGIARRLYNQLAKLLKGNDPQ